jgi:phage baseplate assembly protein W|tara:strand:+ start:297 stop:713 length:417 start_codon:yes stop_codon:yes gene_type:complete
MVDLVNNGKTVATKDIYSDLDIFFRKHPITGDVVRKTDTDAIKRSVRNIVLTNKFERPFKPNFGGSIRNLLFELNTDRQINRMKITLAKEIEVLEPRVNNVQVALSNQDNNKLDMTIFYNITNGSPNQEIEINVSRTR